MPKDLITLSEYKTLMNKNVNKTEEDGKLSAIIKSVSGLIKTYCGNSFVDYVEEPYIQTVTMLQPTNRIFLREMPLIELISVEARTPYSSSFTEVSSGYLYDEDTESLVSLSGVWPTGPSSIKITYKAGYETLPEELKMTAANLVHYFDQEQYKTSPMNIGGTSLIANVDMNRTPFPGHIKRTLDQYRSML